MDAHLAPRSPAEAAPPPTSVVAANKLEETGSLLVPWGCRATGRGVGAGPVEEVSHCEGPVSGSLPRTGRRWLDLPATSQRGSAPATPLGCAQTPTR
jgi:hypothetical protein